MNAVTYKSNRAGWSPIAPAAVERDHSVVDKHATHVHVSAWSNELSGIAF